VRASKQKLLLGVGLLGKILLFGVHPDLGSAGSTPPNEGISFNNWAGASKQKLLLGVGLHGKNFGGLTLTQSPQGPPTQKGVFAFKLSS
jgi:hypothetical protein